MSNILDTLKENIDANLAYDELNNFVKENSDALETIVKAGQLFLDKFTKSSKEMRYGAYREIARAYKKKNLVQSNYPYDSQNYIEAAEYYLKASKTAPNDGRKLSSLDGAASMYWNLDDKSQWCKVKLQQAEVISDKDKTRLFLDIARETADAKHEREMLVKAYEFAPQMSGDVDVKAETIDRLKKMIGE